MQFQIRQIDCEKPARSEPVYSSVGRISEWGQVKIEAPRGVRGGEGVSPSPGVPLPTGEGSGEGAQKNFAFFCIKITRF